MYDFAPDPIWISLYLRKKMLFPFLSAYYVYMETSSEVVSPIYLDAIELFKVLRSQIII